MVKISTSNPDDNTQNLLSKVNDQWPVSQLDLLKILVCKTDNHDCMIENCQECSDKQALLTCLKKRTQCHKM